jgi:TRAP-type mannitol/chloroaromatic compound transport system substrate-binding protein
MSFQEVAKYVIISPSRAPSDPQIFIFNTEAWAELPQDLQVLVQNVVGNYTQMQHEYLTVESTKAIDRFRSFGNEVYQLPADVEQAVLDAADAFYSRKVASEPPIFGEIYNSMKAYGDAYAAMQ